MPFLFQRRYGSDDRPITRSHIPECMVATSQAARDGLGGVGQDEERDGDDPQHAALGLLVRVVAAQFGTQVAQTRVAETSSMTGRVPRLLLHGEPGSVVGPSEVDWCRRESAGLEIVSVGAGTHFLPEDQSEAFSHALATWLAGRGRSHVLAA